MMVLLTHTTLSASDLIVTGSGATAIGGKNTQIYI